MSAVKTVLDAPWRYVEWLAVSAAIWFFLVMIPVWTTPGDDFFFRLSITPPLIIALMVFLSLLNGLLIMMQLYIRKTVRAKKLLRHKVADGATAFGIFVSALSATIACAACYSALFAFLGLGTTTFLVNHRLEVGTFAVVLTLVALYYSAKRINNHCEVCSIH